MGEKQAEAERGFLAENPWLLVFAVVLTLGGALAGYLWLSPEWTDLRRVAAGAVAGAGIVILIGGPKLFVY